MLHEEFVVSQYLLYTGSLKIQSTFNIRRVKNIPSSSKVLGSECLVLKLCTEHFLKDNVATQTELLLRKKQRAYPVFSCSVKSCYEDGKYYTC